MPGAYLPCLQQRGHATALLVEQGGLVDLQQLLLHNSQKRPAAALVQVRVHTLLLCLDRLLGLYEERGCAVLLDPLAALERVMLTRIVEEGCLEIFPVRGCVGRLGLGSVPAQPGVAVSRPVRAVQCIAPPGRTHCSIFATLDTSGTNGFLLP